MSLTRRAVPVVDVVVSCIVVYAFAIAQPLLDLLGRNAEFFVARRSPASDVIATALIVAVLIPGVLALVVAGVSRLHAPTGTVLHWIVLTVLGGVLAVQIFNHTPIADLTGWIQVVLALAFGVLLTLAFYRLSALRWVFRFGAITPLLIVALFLFASPVSKLLFGSPAEALGAVAVAKPAPVVMLVFDEFPVASLMDANGDLQRDLYPNFARLADEGTWYRNATGVQQQTMQALPAILTGVDPPPDKLPMAADYPNSLFTLLADSYDITAYEPVTELCPDYACPESTQPDVSTAQRWRTLSSDLAVISGHLFLPDDFTTGLPSIDHSWSNFAAEKDAIESYDIVSEFNERVREDRRLYIEDFIDGLPDGAAPSDARLHPRPLPPLSVEHAANGADLLHPGAVPGLGDDRLGFRRMARQPGVPAAPAAGAVRRHHPRPGARSARPGRCLRRRSGRRRRRPRNRDQAQRRAPARDPPGHRR